MAHCLTHSPFGNVRMLVPPGALLDPSINNFYFADFYCNYYTHYVTVVICRKGSETDNYCYTRLYQINAEDNPFLTVIRPSHPHYPPTYWVNSGVWVEIYYTEDVPLWLGRFDNILTTGAGTSKIGGLPNNKHCQRCNLYPVPYPDEAVTVNDDGATGVADITVAEDPLNSTFRVLMNERKEGVAEEWEDIVGSIPVSDAIIDAALASMDKELEKCRDITVKKSGSFLKE
ncbi:hypothetical protein OESDEN_17848, partial [Oesophagostomum dentatum]